MVPKGSLIIVAVLLLAVEARGQVTIDGETVKQRQAHPSETYSASFAVRNASREPQDVRIYQTDYFTTAQGTTTYGAPGTLARSNASWVALGPARIVVPPNQSVSVPFTVTVPPTPSLAGSYWSLVMVEAIQRATEPAAPPRPGELRINSRIRYAVAIVTDVPVSPKRLVEFDAPSALLGKDSTRVLQFDVKNVGNLAFRPSVSVELYAQDGTHVKSLSTTREMSYPGTSFRHRVDFGLLPRGKYRAIVTLDAGEDALFGAQYTLNF